jgi:hypothetical protein
MAAEQSKTYIVKAVIGAKNVILPDLGAVRLLSSVTYDLGKFFRVDALRYSKDLANAILNGDLTLYDRNDIKVNVGIDLCDMLAILETLNAGSANVSCERTVFSHPDGSGSEITDEISEYVHITRDNVRGIYNLVEEDRYDTTDDNVSPVGTSWAYVEDFAELVQWRTRYEDGENEEICLLFRNKLEGLADQIWRFLKEDEINLNIWENVKSQFQQQFPMTVKTVPAKEV